MYIYINIHISWTEDAASARYVYGVSMISSLLKILGLFCKIALQKRLHSAKTTYHCKEPTNRSQPVVQMYQYVYTSRHIHYLLQTENAAGALCKLKKNVRTCHEEAAHFKQLLAYKENLVYEVLFVVREIRQCCGYNLRLIFRCVYVQQIAVSGG